MSTRKSMSSTLIELISTTNTLNSMTTGFPLADGGRTSLRYDSGKTVRFMVAFRSCAVHWCLNRLSSEEREETWKVMKGISKFNGFYVSSRLLSLMGNVTRCTGDHIECTPHIPNSSRAAANDEWKLMPKRSHGAVISFLIINLHRKATWNVQHRS